MKYQTFVFDSYAFEPQSKTLTLRYALDAELSFAETYRFDFDFADYLPEELDQAVQSLFFMAGVSYYKTYLPPKISVNQGQLDAQDASFFRKTYQRGLGEFFYVNNLDPQTVIPFPTTTQKEPSRVTPSERKGQLIGLGGGKDSLVSVELLRNQANTATWSVGHRPQLTPLVGRTGLPHLWVERQWDPQLQTLNAEGAYNGHVPISAILATVGVVVAVLSGYQDVVVSNENSANEPTLTYQNIDINHQYSKSLEFEQDFQAHLARKFDESIRYYSFLRPLSELKIAEIFARVGFDKYKGVFSSCNRAFTHASDSMFWCGECPKCAFVFLALTPFVDRQSIEALFHGKNLLLESSLGATYQQLLGTAGEKPLECVGEAKESRAAMRLAQQVYPELSSYEFELPDSYDYRALAAHSMPADIYQILISQI